jgi:cell division septation protein DedD
MHEVFDEEEFEPVPQQRDTELTLGPMLLLGIFFGLMLLCGLCFGLGYSMGSRGAHDSPATGQQTGSQTSSSAAGSLPKPSAVPQNISHLPQGVVGLPPPEASGADAVADSQNPGLTSDPGSNSAQPVIKPALPAAATAPTPASGQPAPATAPTLALMVQIAAVSHQEDADVLVGALRKRGYAVTVRRDPADNQFHVRIGPFTSRNDANATRQKLLNDGYNAIVQP